MPLPRSASVQLMVLHAAIFAPMSVAEKMRCRMVIFGSMASGPLTSHTYLSVAVIGAPLLLKVTVPVALPPAAAALNDTATVNAAVAASVIFVHELIRFIWHPPYRCNCC